MRLSKVLLVAGAGVLVYKTLEIIVKLQVPREVAELDIFVGDISKAIFSYREDIEAGEDKEKAIEKLNDTLGVTMDAAIEKEVNKVQEATNEAINLHFENATKENENKTNMSMKEKVVELTRERPISMQEASHEIASEVQGTTDKAKELIEDYHKNYKEVTV